jgi:uncharacterized membrane protein
MRYLWLMLCCASLSATAVAQQKPGLPAQAGEDLAAKVLKVFEAKCNECHGSQVKKPPKKFGYILDLKRVAANPKLVVPSKLDQSKLWKMVDDGDMPPEDAKAGPLNKEEQKVIHDWIAAGAPSGGRTSPPPSIDQNTEPDRAEQPLLKRVLILAGRFHVLTVHFPIGLILAAALGELWFWWQGFQGLHPAVRFSILLGAAVGLAAAGLGWIHAWNGAGVSEPETLFIHRWLGTVAAVLLVAIAAASEIDARRGSRSFLGRLLLFVGAVLIGLTGHFGGLLTHGEDFFNI